MPQTLAGLSPGTLLQQYQQYQPRTWGPAEAAEATAGQAAESPAGQDLQAESEQLPPNPSDASETKGDKSPATESTKEEPQLESKSADFQDPLTLFRASSRIYMQKVPDDVYWWRRAVLSKSLFI